MITNDLIQFVRSSRAQGLNDEVIKERLRASGWPESDIQEALGGPTPPPPSSQLPSPPPLPSQASQAGRNTGMAVIAYLGILAIIPLIAAKDDPYVKFHLKQGLVLLALEIIFLIFSIIPIFFIFIPIVYLGLLVLSIIGIVNAVKGEEKLLPLVGQWGTKFNI